MVMSFVKPQGSLAAILFFEDGSPKLILSPLLDVEIIEKGDGMWNFGLRVVERDGRPCLADDDGPLDDFEFVGVALSSGPMEKVSVWRRSDGWIIVAPPF